MNKVNVLVTGIGGGAIGEQILKALKLSVIDMKVVGTDTTSFCKNIYEVDLFIKVPPASSSGYANFILDVAIKNNIKVIFPGSEPELKALSKARKLFQENDIFLPINTETVIDICLDKVKTVEFLHKNGFHSPKSVKIESISDLSKVDFFPAVLKPSIGGSGSANIMIAQTKDELMVFGQYLLNIYSEYIIQEYIGDTENEFTVGILADMNGKIINSIALKRFINSGLGSKIKVKNRTGKSELGENLVISSGISQGEIGKFDHITKPCEEIALKLGAKSSLNIQCRYYQEKVYVFEINPRYSGTTSMRAMVGYNEPDVLIRIHILGEEILSKFHFENRVILRGLNETMIMS
jgi:carbamoyl-phosphate synthase large subunit